jgi:RimJ/RimL family protein N-acetyltransferase
MDFADLPELETERLLLRKMRPDDAGTMFACASDPGVTRPGCPALDRGLREVD